MTLTIMFSKPYPYKTGDNVTLESENGKAFMALFLPPFFYCIHFSRIILRFYPRDRLKSPIRFARRI